MFSILRIENIVDVTFYDPFSENDPDINTVHINFKSLYEMPYLINGLHFLLALHDKGFV